MCHRLPATDSYHKLAYAVRNHPVRNHCSAEKMHADATGCQSSSYSRCSVDALEGLWLQRNRIQIHAKEYGIPLNIRNILTAALEDTRNRTPRPCNHSLILRIPHEQARERKRDDVAPKERPSPPNQQRLNRLLKPVCWTCRDTESSGPDLERLSPGLITQS